MVTIKHKFQALQGDPPDDTLVKPSNWNDVHDIELSKANVVVGRATSGAGPAEELPVTAYGRGLMNTVSAAALASTLEGELSFVPTSRTVTGGGLATGGGALSSNQTITVTGASSAEAIDGTLNNVAMTPLRTANYVNNKRADKATAEAGTDNDTLMTPLRTKQAIEARNSEVVNSGTLPVGTMALCILKEGAAVSSVADGVETAGTNIALAAIHRYSEDANLVSASPVLSGTWKNVSGLTIEKVEAGTGTINAVYFVRTA